VYRHHSFCLELAQRNVNSPAIGANIAKAVIGEIDTFANAHTGMAEQQEDVGRQIVAAEQLLLDELILLRRQGTGKTLRRPRRVLATDQMRQLRKLGGPGKFLKDTSEVRETIDVDRRRQGAQVGEPAKDMRVAAQLIQRSNIRMILAEINQEVARGATVLTG